MDFRHELGNRVCLNDLIGNKNHVVLQKHKHCGYLTIGWVEICHHYSIDSKDGAWLMLNYVGRSLFTIKIEDRNFNEISDPRPLHMFAWCLKYEPQNDVSFAEDKSNDEDGPKATPTPWNTHQSVQPNVTAISAVSFLSVGVNFCYCRWLHRA